MRKFGGKAAMADASVLIVVSRRSYGSIVQAQHAVEGLDAAVR